MISFKKYHVIRERASKDSSDARTIVADPEFLKKIDKAIEKANVYTDKRIKEIEKKLDKIDTKGGGKKDDTSQYTVSGGTGDAYINVVDINTGAVITRIAPRGAIVTSPEVQGDLVSFQVESPDGSRIGTVHKIPSGTLVSQFRVSSIGKGIDIKGSEQHQKAEAEKEIPGLRGLPSGTGAVTDVPTMGGSEEDIEPLPIPGGDDAEEIVKRDKEERDEEARAALGPALPPPPTRVRPTKTPTERFS